MFEESLRIVLLCHCIGRISGDLVMTASPSALIPGLTHELVLRCSLTPSNMDSNIRVLALQIEKVVGDTLQGLASISLGDSAPRLDHLATGLTVEGAIPLTSAINSSLQLTVDSPGHRDTGDYVCVMSAMASSLLMNLKANVTVAEIEQGDDPYATALLHAIRRLKDDLVNVTQRVQDCGCGGESSGGGGGGSRPPQSVSFTARPGLARPFQTGRRMVFEVVDVNIGGHYDSTRGVFTAPVNGTYVMMATMSVQEAKTLTDLIVNHQRRGQLVTSDDDQTSISLVLDLRAGDEVWLQGIFDSHNSTDTDVFADKDTLFSGFLLDPY